MGRKLGGKEYGRQHPDQEHSTLQHYAASLTLQLTNFMMGRVIMKGKKGEGHLTEKEEVGDWRRGPLSKARISQRLQTILK